MKRTAVIAPGREVIVFWGDGDNQCYATVRKIDGDIVYIDVPGRKRVMKFDISEVRVEVGRGKIIKAKL